MERPPIFERRTGRQGENTPSRRKSFGLDDTTASFEWPEAGPTISFTVFNKYLSVLEIVKDTAKDISYVCTL